MIGDFLTANLKNRVAHGQPLVLDGMRQYYAHCARVFEAAGEAEQRAARGVAREIGQWVDPPSERARLLFVRPKSPRHGACAAGKYQVIQIDEGSMATPSVQDGILHLPLMYWHWLVHRTQATDGDTAVLWHQVLCDEITEFLDRLRPAAIFVNTDVHLLERAMAVVARGMGIPLVTIQNGLFSSKYHPSVHDGDASDFMIAWSPFTQRLIAAAGAMPTERILVAGYPYPVANLGSAGERIAANKTVVFLGQPYEAFQAEQAEAKRRIARTVREVCGQVRLAFRYRPHPGERQESFADFVPSAEILPRSQPLGEVFAEYGAFVGLTSSALVEAGLHRRVAIQVYDDIFNSDHLGEAGAIHAVSTDPAQLAAMLRQVLAGTLAPLTVSADYLPIPEDLDATFLAAYESILATWNGMDRRQPISVPAWLDIASVRRLQDAATESEVADIVRATLPAIGSGERLAAYACLWNWAAGQSPEPLPLGPESDEMTFVAQAAMATGDRTAAMPIARRQLRDLMEREDYLQRADEAGRSLRDGAGRWGVLNDLPELRHAQGELARVRNTKIWRWRERLVSLMKRNRP